MSKAAHAYSNPFPVQPWRVAHHSAGHSEIQAFSAKDGAWHIVATVWDTATVKSPAIAEFLVRVVNDEIVTKDILADATDALNAILSEGVDFSNEQAADRIIGAIAKLVSGI